MLALLRKFADTLERACLYLGVACLLYMVVVVSFNVVARIIFDATDTSVNMMIPGAIEQVSYLLGIIALAALSVSLAHGMIAVDFIVTRLPASAQIAVARFWFLGVAVFGIVLCYLFNKEMLATHSHGEASQDLRIPMYLIHGLYAFECFALAVIALREAAINNGQHAELT